jgi:hypothetical protein
MAAPSQSTSPAPVKNAPAAVAVVAVVMAVAAAAVAEVAVAAVAATDVISRNNTNFSLTQRLEGEGAEDLKAIGFSHR